MLYWLIICTVVVLCMFSCTMRLYLQHRLAQSMAIFDHPLQGTFGSGQPAADSTESTESTESTDSTESVHIQDVAAQIMENR